MPPGMTIQQYMQLIQRLQGMGFSQQQATQLITGYQQQQMFQQMMQPQQPALTPAQQIGLGVMGPLALGMQAAPYDLQMQAARQGMDPYATARGINAVTPQLTKGAISALTRATAPGIAGSGLASAPGMSQQILAEAFAPHIVQEQQLGKEAYFAGQDMPFKVGSGMAGQLPSSLIDYALLMGMTGP